MITQNEQLLLMNKAVKEKPDITVGEFLKLLKLSRRRVLNILNDSETIQWYVKDK